MRWVPNPWWDGVWLLSGLPFGLLLLCLSNVIPAALLTFWLIGMLQQ